MKNEIDEVIFSKHYNGCRPWILISDLPTDLLPTDKLSIDNDNEGYYSDNNSWDPNTQVTIYRSRLETDEEYSERIEKEKKLKEEGREIRYKNYLKLKEEFENDKGIYSRRIQ